MAGRKDGGVGDSTRNGLMIKSVLKAMKIINKVSQSDEAGISITELCRFLGENRSVVYRLVTTLESEGFLIYDRDRRQVCLGLTVFRLGSMDRYGRVLTHVVHPHMMALSAETGHTSYLSILEHDKALIIATYEGHRHVRTMANPWEWRPLHTTALGKILLAGLSDQALQAIVDRLHLDRITPRSITSKETLMRHVYNARRLGYAMSEEENYEGITAVAAPIVSISGETMAAMSVSFPTAFVPSDELEKTIDMVKRYAWQASLSLNKHRRVGPSDGGNDEGGK